MIPSIFHYQQKNKFFKRSRDSRKVVGPCLKALKKLKMLKKKEIGEEKRETESNKSKRRESVCEK